MFIILKMFYLKKSKAHIVKKKKKSEKGYMGKIGEKE